MLRDWLKEQRLHEGYIWGHYYSHISRNKRKLFSHTITHFTTMQVSMLCIVIQLQFIEKYIRRKKKAVLIQFRNIFQVKAYFYTHKVKIFKWIETYQNMLIILYAKHILDSSYYFSQASRWVLRKTLLRLHFIYTVKRRIDTLLIWCGFNSNSRLKRFKFPQSQLFRTHQWIFISFIRNSKTKKIRGKKWHPL